MPLFSFGRRNMKLTRRLRPLAPLRNIVVCAVQEWFNHRASSKGAALAFYTLFSMSPILVLVLAIAGLFYGQQAAQGELFEQLRGLLGTQGAQAVQLILSSAHNQANFRFAAALAGVLFFFFFKQKTAY